MTTAILIVSPLYLYSAEDKTKGFDATHIANDRQLKLVGIGLLRYYGFKAYKGAFYLEAGVPPDKALEDVAKRIELEYLRPFKGEDFGPATDRGIAANVDSQTMADLKDRIDYHNSLYEDIQPGDRYALTYIPGKGTELARNGNLKGKIEGADFAAAIFSIWLGPKPASASFKKQLLAQ